VRVQIKTYPDVLARKREPEPKRRGEIRHPEGRNEYYAPLAAWRPLIYAQLDLTTSELGDVYAGERDVLLDQIVGTRGSGL
jgi:hypothetical protein